MPLERFRGDTDPILVTIRGASGPLNLTGCTDFVLTADPSNSPATGSSKIFSLIGAIVDPLQGTVEFLPSASDMDHVGIFWFDVQFKSSRGFTKTAGKDMLTLQQDISK